MNKTIQLCGVIIVAILIAGCIDPSPEAPPITDRVRDIYLEDGTRCVLYTGSRAEAGLSCDWGRLP